MNEETTCNNNNKTWILDLIPSMGEPSFPLCFSIGRLFAFAMLRSLIGNNNNVATTTTNGNGSTTTTMNPSLSFERHTVKVPAVELATDIYESLHEEDRPLLRHVWKILYEISYRDAFTEEDERPWGIC